MARPYNDETGRRKLTVAGGKSYVVSIPIEIIRTLGWKPGDTLEVRRQGKTLLVSKDKE